MALEHLDVAVVLAHPLTQRGELPVSPLIFAVGAVYILLTASGIATWRARRTTAAPPVVVDTAHDDDPMPADVAARGAFWAARAIGLGLFVLAIVAALIGTENQLLNIAPALTVGSAWPMLTLASILLGRVWWWVNPYDTLARPLEEVGAGRGSGRDADGSWAPVWWAVPVAAAWMMWLTVWPGALAPRSLGVALVVYTLFTLAACLAIGRTTWLWRGEFFTVFFGLLASVRTRRTAWTPPAGGPAVLGVVSGGALFGLFRDSDLALFLRVDVVYSTIAVIAFMAIAGFGAERAARRAAAGSVTTGLAPMAAMLVVALAIARNRLTTSLQLLPIVASNPLGGDLDLFGTRYNGLHPQPLGDVGPVWLQAALLLAGAIAGMLLARRFAGRADPASGARFSRNRTIGVMLALLGTLLGIGAASAAAI